MKNITIALDDEIYRKARIAAAQRDTSVSALVKKYPLYLLYLVEENPAPRNPKQEQEALPDSLWRRHPAFTSVENLTREDLYDRS